MKVEIWKLIQFTPNFFDGGILFTLYLYYILLFSIFQRTFWCHAHFSERDGLQSYNIFLNYQNISKKIFHFSFKHLLFCFAGNLSRLRMQRYNIFSNYQNIFKFFLKLFYKSLFFKKKIFYITSFFMLKNMFLPIFLSFFTNFQNLTEVIFSRFRFFSCFFDYFTAEIISKNKT